MLMRLIPKMERLHQWKNSGTYLSMLYNILFSLPVTNKYFQNENMRFHPSPIPILSHRVSDEFYCCSLDVGGYMSVR